MEMLIAIVRLQHHKPSGVCMDGKVLHTMCMCVGSCTGPYPMSQNKKLTSHRGESGGREEEREEGVEGREAVRSRRLRR